MKEDLKYGCVCGQCKRLGGKSFSEFGYHDDYDDFFKLCLKKKISVYDLCGQPDFALKEKKNDFIWERN